MKSSLSRRKFVSVFSLGTSAFLLPNIKSSILLHKEEIDWYNVEDWGVEGKGWKDTEEYYDRLPARAKRLVRDPVWRLSRNSAGMAVHFATDATQISVRYSLRSERLAMPHMPATGVSGLDLYAQDHSGMKRWVAVLKPEQQEIETTLAKDLAAGSRQYTIYLPLYNGVKSLEIGVPSGMELQPVPPRQEKPMVFYGTSILHGACASRPGMAFPSILGRRLRRPSINLGFSGNGRMEPELADLLSELDPCLYALDCLPNMNAEMVTERVMPFVQRLKDDHPVTPILLVEDRANTNSQFFPKRAAHHRANRNALRMVFRKLKNMGHSQIYYLSGDKLLGSDGEAATDGSHPSDLGMMRYADAYEPALREMLGHY